MRLNENYPRRTDIILERAMAALVKRRMAADMAAKRGRRPTLCPPASLVWGEGSFMGICLLDGRKVIVSPRRKVLPRGLGTFRS